MDFSKRVPLKDLKNHLDREVEVSGFIDARRDHGKLIFMDLRDETGKLQMVSTPKNKDVHEEADKLREEAAVSIRGLVKKRPDNMINDKVANGDLELTIHDLSTHSRAETPSIDLQSDGYDIAEEKRIRYRYIDLRRERMQKNIRARHEITRFAREYLYGKNFTEIETPLLTKSTPEGARDYVVPSRLYPGKFYALPQSPQQYKQLLMMSGFEKYFQFARCMRDEDTRGNRQPEFTQLDIEMAFVSQEGVLELVEEMFTGLVGTLYPHKKITQCPWPRLAYADVMDKYGTDRPDLRQNPEDADELALAWILDFPLFEPELENGHLAPSHHMFTQPKEEDLNKLASAPHDVRSYQHDLVINGAEIAGGSIRIHSREIQEKIFELIGFGEKQKNDFAHMLEAFQQGVPPHGGIAVGFDRLVSILQNEKNIREVIAFPKTGEGRDPLMNSPTELDNEQLNELHLGVQSSEEDQT